MVQDAEKNAEADKAFQELVNTCNQAETAVYSLKKAMEENKDKVTDEEKQSIEPAIQAVEEAISKKDKEAIDSSLQALQAASGAFMQKVYSQEQAKQSAEPASTGQEGKNSDTIDAEFNETDSDK